MRVKYLGHGVIVKEEAVLFDVPDIRLQLTTMKVKFIAKSSTSCNFVFYFPMQEITKLPRDKYGPYIKTNSNTVYTVTEIYSTDLED
jgi:hypothetical protein